jgi:Acetoacetate decarboxylase (ADC)
MADVDRPLLDVWQQATAYAGMSGGDWTPPAPQLLRDVPMLIVGYRADRDALCRWLPPGLEAHESGVVQMNMYECPDARMNSGFGAFTLTYLTVEVAGHDSYAADGSVPIPGRYWVGYWTDSDRVRRYARESVGIPALAGSCAWQRDGDRLRSTLTVGQRTVIEAEAVVGSSETGVLGGQLHYYAHRQLPVPEGGRNQVSELLEVPIPFVASLYDASVEAVRFSFPDGSPWGELAPVDPLEIGGVLHGRVTFTYSMARRVRDYLAP